MTPQISSINMQSLKVVPHPSRTYKVMAERIEGFVNNLDAIKQTIRHILSTERYAYVIYPDTYGIELQQFIGKSFEYVKANIRRTLREALTQDDRIVDIRINSIQQISLNECDINFTVISNLGDIEEAINIVR